MERRLALLERDRRWRVHPWPEPRTLARMEQTREMMGLPLQEPKRRVLEPKARWQGRRSDRGLP